MRGSLRSDTPLAKKGPEAEFQDAVAAYARTMGWLVMAIAPGLVREGRLVTNMRYDGAGWPDLTLIRDQVIFAELKGKGIRKLREDQVKWRDAIIRAGGDWRVWNPSDWKVIEDALRRPRS